MRFTVLGSGSSGNASLLEWDGFVTLLDAGFGPRQLAARMSDSGAHWDRIQAALLTHTHSDHWNDRTFYQLARRGIPLYCHAEHASVLGRQSDGFTLVLGAGLVRHYEAAVDFSLTPHLRCLPLPVCHDCGPTFGFRFRAAEEGCPPRDLAYVADLGSWTPDLARALANVELLALEFNHDVGMEYASGRSTDLIARVLGDYGHLSNLQASDLLGAVLHLSEPGRLKRIVQLHLSRDCNRPALAEAAARVMLDAFPHAVDLHTAARDCPSPTFVVDGLMAKPIVETAPKTSRGTREAHRSLVTQPCFPGWD